MTRHGLRRLVALLLIVTVAWQLAWLVRIALLPWIDPSSTAMQRSQAWRLAREAGGILPPRWDRRWIPIHRMAPTLPRAVIASEDSQFVKHRGVDWRALQAAWKRNQRHPGGPTEVPGGGQASARAAPALVGGSTLTQQLVKNLFLSGERTLWRKAQELVLALALDAWVDKRRLLEIYLNHVEWGEGVFGAEAAAHRHFKTKSRDLDARQSARLAVMLPAPRRFEKRGDSAYLQQRVQTILARMELVQLP